MLTRRSVIEYIALLAAGAGLYAVYPADVKLPNVPEADVPDIGVAEGDGSQDKPEKVILEVNLSNEPFERVTFYNTGKAEVLFTEDHNTDRFGVTHAALESPEDHFNVWDTPRFQGPKTINLKRVIVNNGPYPENKFKFGVHYDASDKYYIGPSPPEFRVPTAWYKSTDEN